MFEMLTDSAVQIENDSPVVYRVTSHAILSRIDCIEHTARQACQTLMLDCGKPILIIVQFVRPHSSVVIFQSEWTGVVGAVECARNQHHYQV